MKFRIGLIAGIISTSVHAGNPVSQPLGTNTTLGATSNVWALSSASNNPASSFMLVGEGEKVRFGLLTSIAGGYEFGAVEDLKDKLDDLDEKLDGVEDNLSEALTLQTDFNDIIAEIGDNGSIKGMLGGTVPLTPFIYKTDNYGAFTLTADITTMGAGKVLADEARILLNPLTREFQLNTATSIYVKNYLDVKFSVGYSNELYTGERGTLLVGGRANFHEVTLGKSVLSLSALTGDEIDDAIEGEVEDNQLTTSGTSFDLGLIWSASNYQIGVTVNNLSEPTFGYKSLGTDCTDIIDNNSAKINCFAAAEFAGRGMINNNEIHTMAQQTTVEMSFFSESKTWGVSASYDANAINDALGDQYQWSNVAAQIHPGWLLVSGIRAGYRKNNVGSELSYASVGATLMKGINFDVSYGLESVEDIPRSVYLSLGIEESF